jgi:CheY-like chemotaxis protein
MSETAHSESCVLVVDDDEDVRDTLREVIEMIGCSAATARNGAEALDMLAVSRPCLVILDLLMPVMSGEEMIEAMRKDPSYSLLPVLISTSAPGQAPRGLPVLAKPIDIEKLWSWMRRTCTCLTAPRT